MFPSDRRSPSRCEIGDLLKLVNDAEEFLNNSDPTNALSAAAAAQTLARDCYVAVALSSTVAPSITFAILASRALAVAGIVESDLFKLGEAEALAYRALRSAEAESPTALVVAQIAAANEARAFAQVVQSKLNPAPDWLPRSVGPGAAASRGIRFHRLAAAHLIAREYGQAERPLTAAVCELAVTLGTLGQGNHADVRENLAAWLARDLVGVAEINSLHAEVGRAIAASRQALAIARQMRNASPPDDDKKAGLERLALASHARHLLGLNDKRSLAYVSQLLRELEDSAEQGGNVEELFYTHFLRAHLLRQQEEPARALAEVDEALALATSAVPPAVVDPSEAQGLRAQILRETGDLTEAEKAVDGLLNAAQPASASEMMERAQNWLTKGEIVLESGDPGGASRAALEALRLQVLLNPTSGVVHRALDLALRAANQSGDVADNLLIAQLAVVEVMETELSGPEGISFREAGVRRAAYARLTSSYVEKEWWLPAVAVADRSRGRGVYLALTPRSGVLPSSAPAGPADVRLKGLGELAEWLIDFANTRLGSLGVPRPLDFTEIPDLTAQVHGPVLMLEPIGDQLWLFLLRGSPSVRVHQQLSPVSLPVLSEALLQVRRSLGVTAVSTRNRFEGPPPSSSGPSVDAALEGPLNVLWRGIYEPVAALVKPGESLHISPFRELLFIPFGMMAPRQTEPMLLERHPLSILPSLMLLRTIRGSHGEWSLPVDSVAYVVGDPELSDVDRASLRPLPAARLEASELGTSLAKYGLETSSLIVKTAGDADERSFFANVEKSRLIHLACHAEVLEAAEASRLYLAPATPMDGHVTAYEIGALRLNDPVVFLSACETGLGRATTDGVLGLATSFLAAGARAVIASQWQVSDSATRVLAGHFYKDFLGPEGGDVASALQKAMLATKSDLEADLIREADGSPTGPGPRSWAPFFVVGDGDARTNRSRW
jgi:hypothetical protein